MTIRNELIDELLAGQDPSSVMRQDGLLGELKKALLNRLMAAEFEHHLTEDRALGEGRNHRNGSTRKRVLTDDSHVEVTIPRDREARFDPVLIGKYQRRLPGFDDKVISLYTRGMSTREIQGHLEEIYGAEVSPQLISTVTDAVAAEVAEWQSRPLEPLYPVMFFDAIRVKVRDQGTVCNKAVYLALGITTDGRKHILGLWIDPNEGAKFWLRIVNELRNRGVKDILIAVVDGLKGFPEAINAAFPQPSADYSTGFAGGTLSRLRPGANLHRASAAQRPGLRVLAGPQAGRWRAEADLPRTSVACSVAYSRCRKAGAGCLRSRPVGSEIRRDRTFMATAMGSGDPVLRLPARGASDHLHHQCNREPQQHTAHRRSQPRTLPHRRGCDQTAVFGLAPCEQQLEECSTRMDRRHDAVRHHVRRSVQRRVEGSSETDTSHKISDRPRDRGQAHEQETANALE